MVQRVIGSLQGSSFFEGSLPVYINRAVESFGMFEHTHDFLEISYVSEGSGVHYTEASSIQVSQGDIILIPVGVSHVFRPSSPSPSKPLVVRNCLIDTDKMAPFLQGFPGGAPLKALLSHVHIRNFRDRDGECGKLFQRLHYEYAARRPAWEAALYAVLLELLLHLHRLQEEQPGSIAPSPGALKETLQLLHSQFALSLSTSTLAAKAGLGERQFQRLFAKHTGMSPIAYLQTLRVQEACRLLRETDWKLTAISSAVGYQDPAHFTALFKRVVGCPPGRYRKLVRQGSL
ncbi:AraC family transcriptional regulator [Paenibacillus herberti]|uniref:AraC family transcriptional regulator n=1 Tax=Paenibacillus herberti TaxID=1619309 RepID=A0A229P4R3_9BACL|nr:AraC family transcriptional regulator [Paenibacillus herberti]OXM16849.1 AraC family transcriptional regulator [Paenibacillus herberti]